MRSFKPIGIDRVLMGGPRIPSTEDGLGAPRKKPRPSGDSVEFDAKAEL
jgi:hypothetical protein